MKNNFCLFLLLLGIPGIAQSQQNPPTVKPSDWSEWRSAPNLPDIKVRVLCSTYLESSGKAEWNYQFLNTYNSRVDLVFKDETDREPSEVLLGSGEESSVQTAYLSRSCEARTKIYIEVISIDFPTQAKGRDPLKSGSGTNSTGHDASASSSGTQNQKASSSSSIGSVGPASAASASNSRRQDLAGTWGYEVDPAQHMFLVFAADGTFIFRNGEVDGNAYGHWTQDGNAVSIKGEGGTTQDYKDAFTMIGTYMDSARLSVSFAGSVRNYIKLCQADCVNATIDSLNHGGSFRP